jgi:hypothetical protein
MRARTDGPNIPSPIYPKPPGYPEIEVGLDIRLRRTINKGWKRYRVIGHDSFSPVNKVGTTSPANTNFLIATSGAKKILGSLDGLFETNWDDKDDGQKQLQSTIIGIASDQQLGLILSQPAAHQIGTLKRKVDDDVVITPEMSPAQQPNLWIWSTGDTELPNLGLVNGTEYTPKYYILVIYGDIYDLKEIPDSDKYAYPVDLTHVRTG